MKRLSIGAALAVMATMSACGNSGGGGGGTPAPVPGTARILIKGGTGSGGAGGKGHLLDINNFTGGDVRILRNGAVDASFDVPVLAPYLGTNPLTVSGSLSVTPTLGSALATIPGDDILHPATGIHILPGATLTIQPNYDSDNADLDGNAATGTRERVYLFLPDGLHVQGTLRSGRQDRTNPGDGLSPDAAEFNLTVLGNVVVEASGLVDLRGTNALLAGNGGGISFGQPGLVVCRGTVDASGGSGNAGGDGGRIAMMSSGDSLFVTGTLRTDGGGSGAPNTGGAAGEIALMGANGTHVTGTLSAVGGNGQNGGGGGQVTIANLSAGALVLSADVRTTGGTGSGNFAHGGNGGDILVGVIAGGLRIAGSLESHGGTGPNAVGGAGGAGGSIRILNNTYPGAPAEANQVGASLDTRGGDGLAGGDAGSILIDINNESGNHNASNPGMHLLLIGYESIESSGGDGTSGSHAGDPAASDHPAITVTNYYGYDGHAYMTGSVLNEVPLVARGGSGSTGAGGSGGLIVLSSDMTYADRTDRSVTNTGTVDVQGGDGATTGGFGGRVRVSDRFRTTNTGAMDASGGVGVAGAGGLGGQISFTCLEGPLTNSGALTASGGASNFVNGGDALWGVEAYAVTMFGGSVATSGTVTLRGGASAAATGGRGGLLLVESIAPGAVSSVTGARDVSGGPGFPDGQGGTVYIDGIQVVP